MNLRPYQDKSFSCVLDEWTRVRRTLLVLPTGCGKTIVFCKLAEYLVSQGMRVLILAHRGELLEQAADKMRKATGLGCSVEKAEETSIGEWFRITVGSVQTLMRENRLSKFARDHYDVIIVDEAHHALSDSYQRVLGHFEDAKVLGVTATPDRGDLKNLGQYFETLAFEYSLPQAIRDGFLAPIRAQTIPIKLDMSGVSKTGGDYQVAGLGSALDPYLEQIANEIAERCQARKTVIFTPLIATSQKLHGFLERRGLLVDEVNGDTPDRKERLERFDEQRHGIMLNSMLLTEGWDCPSVDCIVVLRATKVRGLYCQMVGRGTRLSPETGKQDLLLLDFLWHSENHDLCRPAHLICEDAEVADIMTATINESGGAVDIMEAEEQAEGDAVEAREEALAKKLAELQHKKAKLVDPLQYELSIMDNSLVNYVPAFGWEAEKPKLEQVEALEKLNINPEGVECAGKAAKLIDAVKARQAAGLATPKQIRFLEGKGFQHVGKWQMEQARRLIDRIAANKWRVPPDIQAKTYAPPVARPDMFDRELSA
jgi:superfamily II DNA or RNA helicase